MIEKLKKYIKYFDLVRPNDKILLAVSGGVDSVVLLDLFISISTHYNLSLAVVHLNHGLRGKSSDRDERFVQTISYKKGLICFSKKVDVGECIRERKVSPEEGAREIRFQFLSDTLRSMSYDKCALGHHADDQAETIVMNLFQGLGIRGLGGISPRSGQYIHPMLFMSKKEIRAYAKKCGLSFIIDHTNFDRRFLRNRIRHDVLSRWEKDTGRNLVPAICRTGEIVQEVKQFVSWAAESAISGVIEVKSKSEIILDIYKFLQYFKAVQKMVLIRVLETFCHPNQSVRFFEIECILDLINNGKSGSILSLQNGVEVIRDRARIVFCHKKKTFKQQFVQVGKIIDIDEIGIRFRSELLEREYGPIPFSQNNSIEYIDYDSIHQPLCIRPCYPGDVFVPLGMKGKKKVHDFFIDNHVPNYHRSSVPLLVDHDMIIWIMGYRLDNRFKVNVKTKRILKMEIMKLNEPGQS